MEHATLERATADEYLSFRLGAEEYGIEILKVQEIRGCDPVTRIAHMPEFIKGVIDLRGIIVPIVDLRAKFGLAEQRYDDFTVVIIINVAQRTVGIVVDAVSDVVALDRERIKPAPEFGAHIDTRYILGIGKVEERMLIVVDIEHLMTSADMQLVDAATAA